MKILLIISFIGLTFAVPSNREKRASIPRPRAPDCLPEECKLPSCKCSTQELPNGFGKEEIPQIVMLTYDDAVSSLNYNSYYSPLLKNRKNPNGCPVTATFFVCHEYTDYSFVQQLYYEGHEIAVHSITHRTPIQWWATASYEDWQKEMAGQRDIIHRLGKVKKEDIVGIRTPFLQPGGEKQFQMMLDENFLYDSSIPTNHFISPPLWPYTYDYKSIQECPIPNCPKESYKGIWQVPLVSYKDLNKSPCAMVDSCSRPKSEEDAFRLLEENFFRHYLSNRAPFPVFLHAAWFQYDHHYKGMKLFLDFLGNLTDVYIVSVKQAIDWIKNPTSLSNINQFESWQRSCKVDNREKKCKRAKSCPYKTSFGTRYMSYCTTNCTSTYPWFNNPAGDGPMP